MCDDGYCGLRQDTIRCVVASLTDDGGGSAEAGGVGDLLFEELSRPADAEVRPVPDTSFARHMKDTLHAHCIPYQYY